MISFMVLINYYVKIGLLSIMLGWSFMIWWYEDNDVHAVLIYIVVTIMMLYAHDEYEMHIMDYDVMIWGIVTCG